jgi:dATP pyrophosphohydrolase
VPGRENCTGVVLVVARVDVDPPLLLLLRRAGGRFDKQWWPVTGTLKTAEEPLSGALRELAEETSLRPQSIFDTGLSSRDTVGGGALPVFVATLLGEQEVVLNWEHDAYRWCSLSEAQRLTPELAHSSLATAERVARLQPPAQRLFTGDATPAV